jgi:hypothetical protein
LGYQRKERSAADDVETLNGHGNSEALRDRAADKRR